MTHNLLRIAPVALAAAAAAAASAVEEKGSWIANMNAFLANEPGVEEKSEGKDRLRPPHEVRGCRKVFPLGREPTYGPLEEGAGKAVSHVV